MQVLLLALLAPIALIMGVGAITGEGAFAALFWASLTILVVGGAWAGVGIYGARKRAPWMPTLLAATVGPLVGLVVVASKPVGDGSPRRSANARIKPIRVGRDKGKATAKPESRAMARARKRLGL